jgi:nitrate/nitrite transporter NarK
MARRAKTDPRTAERFESPTAALRVLRRRATLLAGFLAVLLVVALTVVLLLLDQARTTDLQRMGLLSILAGLAGGATGALVELIQVFPSARIMSTPSEQPAEDHAPSTPSTSTPEEQATMEDLSSPGWSFNVMLPELIIYPLIGAACGFVVFAGVVGGFLLASGTQTETYSAPGLLFLAFIAGIFSSHFLRRLKVSAEALFGEDEESKHAKERLKQIDEEQKRLAEDSPEGQAGLLKRRTESQVEAEHRTAEKQSVAIIQRLAGRAASRTP